MPNAATAIFLIREYHRNEAARTQINRLLDTLCRYAPIQRLYTIRSIANRTAAGGSAARVARRPGRPAKTRTSNGLHGTIDRLAKNFVEEIRGVLKGASLDDLTPRLGAYFHRGTRRTEFKGSIDEEPT